MAPLRAARAGAAGVSGVLEARLQHAGHGAGSGVLRTRREYLANQQPRHIWMPLLEGEHVSTDAAVVRGEGVWWRHATGVPLEEGMFEH